MHCEAQSCAGFALLQIAIQADLQQILLHRPYCSIVRVICIYLILFFANFLPSVLSPGIIISFCNDLSVLLSCDLAYASDAVSLLGWDKRDPGWQEGWDKLFGCPSALESGSRPEGLGT